MKVSYGDIGQVCVTFARNAGVEMGQVCKISGNGQVAKCADGDQFCGAVLTARGDYAGVCLSGFVTAAYTGTAPTVGYAALSADGAGGVKVDATNGRQILVAAVDTAQKTVTMYW